jgi:thioredoxin reductase (NADPH)
MSSVPRQYERQAQTFPTLSAEQIARIARHGTKRRTRRGELLYDQGTEAPSFFVVISGALDVVRPHKDKEDPITVLGPGQFTGEVNMVTGRRSLARARVIEEGEVLELDGDALRALVQTDSELSELFMRAFILRRVNLIEQHWGDVVLIGSHNSPSTLRLREFLDRNGHPHAYVDVESDADAEKILHTFGVGVEEVPVLICRGETVLRNPTFEKVADCLGFNVAIDVEAVRDMLVVGAGPAGLAAAVYGASEGLDVLVLETHAPGGQAGSSSKIENYLGFPTGISGKALAGRAFTQAEKFGADVAIARSAAKLRCTERPFSLQLSTGDVVRARSVVIASGAQYRKLPLERLADFEGAGVYYAAGSMEAQVCKGEEVIVVGGGNSAGQAATYLAGTEKDPKTGRDVPRAKHVHMLVRSTGLAQSMSRYLIRRIEESPRITLHTQTEIEALEGDSHLERVRWRCSATGTVETRPIRHVFSMTGAVPNTVWVGSCVALDDIGFVKAGSDITSDELAAARWPLQRPPYLLETSVPGVFVVGDARAGSVKRCAAAVGEGAMCVQLVHKILAE